MVAERLEWVLLELERPEQVLLEQERLEHVLLEQERELGQRKEWLQL